MIRADRTPAAVLWLGVFLLIALLAAGGWYGLSHRSPDASAPLTAELATPPGVTLQAIAPGKFGAARLGAGGGQMAFADAQGMTLYRFDNDTGSGVSACTGDCANRWPPAAAPTTAKADGAWSIATRPDGVRQWMFKGKPLYRFADDVHPGDIKGDGVDGVWHVALYQPTDGAPMPFGIAVRELPGGGGQAFVDERAMTLYVLNAAGAAETACPTACQQLWKPVVAPEMAGAIGDFAAVQRHDGIRQWRYRGRPLYSFAGDVAPGDTNGVGVDARFGVALLSRYFMPPDAAVSHHEALGDILTTNTGMTLYARDRFIDADGHNFRTDHGSVATGRALDTASCDSDCARSWPPFIAAADAAPSGYWDIFTRPDGARQWAYKGYALYRYSGDAAPGDVNGNERYMLAPLGKDSLPAQGLYQASLMTGAGTAPAGTGVGALFWRAAIP